MADVVMTVFQYFEYGVLVKEDDKIVEKHFLETPVKLGAFKATESFDKQLERIKGRVAQDSIADIVMVTVFQMTMPSENFENICKMFKKSSEEEVILQIYKQNVLKSNCIVSRGIYPLLFNDRVSINKLIS